MDPALDPPPVSAQPTGAVPSAAPVAATANPAPAQPVAHNHPPYAEMISAALSALNESEGSSKRAIAKYIETNYSGLPPTHPGLLAYNLKRLKTSGQLVMVKHSYKLSTGSTTPAVNGAVSADPASTGTKRRPGRPPKPKPNAVQAAVPVFGSPADPGTALDAVGSSNGPGPGPVRGRGRPPKRGPGRPPKTVGVPSGGSVGRGRGRPKKNAATPVAARGKGPGRPRGRPPKPINVVEGLAPIGGGIPAVPVPVGAPPVTGKRRGRPPKAGGGVAKKPRNVTTVQPRKRSGKPLGRPRKNAVGNQTPESQLLVSYLGLKEKLDTLKEKVNETAALIKPSLNSEAAINALHELEVMATNINAPPEAQQPLPPVQPQI